MILSVGVEVMAVDGGGVGGGGDHWLSLAPSHPVVAGNLTIRRLDFEGKSKFLDVKASGKSKKQCSVVDEKTVLAWIECEPDGQR